MNRQIQPVNVNMTVNVNQMKERGVSVGLESFLRELDETLEINTARCFCNANEKAVKRFNGLFKMPLSAGLKSKH